jgi:formate C-acetyltransferase
MEINPSPLIAATISNCLEKGQDIGQGGPIHNSTGCVGAALANAGDSLLAVKRAVYDEGRYSMAELIEALDANFEGREPMRLYLLKRVPKWGNGHPEADAMAKRIADHYCAKAHSLRNTRGGGGQAALFSLVFQWTAGQVTGALPDGRKAHETLAPNVGAMPGRDLAGATGHIDSVTKLDFTETPNGSVLDIMLHPTAVRGEEGLNAFVQLIKTFFAQGGYAIQFNVFDIDTLRDAQRNPEKYATLQIRVTGWSVYFTSLSRFEQDQFILRNAHGL